MKILLPLIVLFGGAGVAVFLFLSRPEPASREPEVIPTPVEFLVARAGPTTLEVKAQGTVVPLLEATAAAEVGGRIEEASPNLEAGRFVARGEVLVRLDPTDYRAALAEAEAALRSARTALIQTEADAAQAVRDLREVGVENPSPLARREPQLEQARLRVESAEATLDLARENLERTHIGAPFDGQVVEAFVDLGDVLSGRGSPVATIQGTAMGEVRLPLSHEDLRHLDLPATPSEVDGPADEKPPVTLFLGRGEAEISRNGWIDRLEGRTDPRTRLRSAVARLEDPLDGKGGGERAIPFGSFVRAVIVGRDLPRAFRLPVVALVGENRVRVIDAENRLREKKVRIVQRNGTDVVVSGGIEDGERICLTPLGMFVPGMPVRPFGEGGGGAGGSSDDPVAPATAEIGERP